MKKLMVAVITVLTAMVMLTDGMAKKRVKADRTCIKQCRTDYKTCRISAKKIKNRKEKRVKVKECRKTYKTCKKECKAKKAVIPQ